MSNLQYASHATPPHYAAIYAALTAGNIEQANPIQIGAALKDFTHTAFMSDDLVKIFGETANADAVGFL